MGYLDGFGVTLKKLFGPGSDSGRRVTSQYPEQTRPKPERFHGRHVLNRYDDGMEKCIGCELCAGVCPARCIYVRGADNDPDDPTSPGERFGFIYEINYLRCIHCDLCVEACPTEAITETKLFEFAFTNRADAIYTKDELVVDDDGRPQQLPWENWDGGFDPAADTSGWMRATAPSGDADFVGIVAWAGELGYGVRAPQGGGTVVTEPIADLAEPEPVAPDPDAITEARMAGEPVAMAGGTSSIGTFDLVGDPATVAPTTPGGPSEATTDRDEVVDSSTTQAERTDQDDPGSVPDPGDAASVARRAAGFFDAPESDPASAPRTPLGRFRGRRDQPTDADHQVSERSDDIAAEDAAVVAGLDPQFGAPTEDAEPAPADEEAVGLMEPAEVDEDDREERGTPDDGGDGGRPAAGFFDAPEQPEQIEGRKGRRRRGRG